MSRIAVIGAGAWGTALAIAVARAGGAAALWARRPALAARLAAERVNADYLPGVAFPEPVSVPASLGEALTGADAVLLAAPAQHLRTTAAVLAPHLDPGTPVVVCAKGIEVGSGLLLGEVLAEALPGASVAFLSGPTFAADLAAGLPCAATLAAAHDGVAGRLVALLAQPRLRLYRSADTVGVQLGGAVKNVIAIAAGIVEGRGLGDSARAALVTRGLAEMGRLAAAFGADPRTLMGLSGLGDLTLTCTGHKSRNLTLGLAIGRGEDPARLLAGRATVAEGAATARALAVVAARRGVELPICVAVDRVVNAGASVDAELAGMLARPLRAEA